MTVADYADRYGLGTRAVYHAVYAGRIPFSRQGTRLELEDVPPAENPRFRKPQELIDLPDYILALIWFCGTISGDAILVRSKKPEIPDLVASAIRSSSWTRTGTREQRVVKINSPVLCGALRKLGFSGKWDTDRNPPPVEDLAFAKAFTEAHTCFGFALQYDRHKPGDKDAAYYTPRITLCSSPAIVDTYALALASLGIAPLKRSAVAANGKSAVFVVTSRAQLENLSRALSPDLDGYGNRTFWQRFDSHAAAKTIPFYTYHAKSGIMTTATRS